MLIIHHVCLPSEVMFGHAGVEGLLCLWNLLCGIDLQTAGLSHGLVRASTAHIQRIII